MNRTVLKQAGEALWGSQYRSGMARQLNVHLRTVMRWDVGDTRIIPQSAADRLVVLLRAHEAQIILLLGKLREMK